MFLVMSIWMLFTAVATSWYLKFNSLSWTTTEVSSSTLLSSTIPTELKVLKSEILVLNHFLDKLTIRSIEQDEAIVTEVNLAGVEQVL